jgi:hypothetical protein
MKLLLVAIACASFTALASARPKLEEVSKQLNQGLPKVYDSITRLRSTSVKDKYFYYHFEVGVSKEEFDLAFPKVQGQILSSVCSQRPERSILLDYQVPIVYSYESLKGQSLGQFMVRPEHCKQKS